MNRRKPCYTWNNIENLKKNGYRDKQTNEEKQEKLLKNNRINNINLLKSSSIK